MGTLPVQTNDVVFSAHATLFSVLTAIQCIIYEVVYIRQYVFDAFAMLIFFIDREGIKKYLPTPGHLLAPLRASFSSAQ